MGYFFLSLTKAILTRALFAVHSFVVIWRVTDVLNDARYWWMICGLLLLISEGTYTLAWRKGREWKWFCPSFFFYLCVVVPGIWFLELDRLSRYRKAAFNGTVYEEEEELSSIQGVKIPIVMSADMWVLSIEQSLLFLLIIGRWLLPKGEITHDQLSQLLFVYIGIASDIMEILILFDEEPVLKDPVLTYAILAMWSFSLMQYTLVLTATRARKTRVTHVARPPPRRREGSLTRVQKLCACCETELWSVVITCAMQDGPFLTIRLYVICAFEIFNYTILFYTCKNFLVLCLQLYRLAIVAGKHFYPEKFAEDLDDSNKVEMVRSNSFPATPKTTRKRINNNKGVSRTESSPASLVGKLRPFSSNRKWHMARFALAFTKPRGGEKARLRSAENGNRGIYYNSAGYISPEMIRNNRVRLSEVKRRLRAGKPPRKATISELYDNEEFL